MIDPKVKMTVEFTSVLVKFKNNELTLAEAAGKLLETAESYKIWTRELKCGCPMGWCDCGG